MNSYNLARISLALNCLLAGVCVLLAVRRPTLTGGPPAVSAQPDANISMPGTRSTPLTAQDIGNRAEIRPWIEVLRNQGVSEKMIAHLALADFEDRWQSRQAAAQEAYNRGDLDAEGLAALAREHDIAQENDLRAHLGEPAFREWDTAQLLQQFNLSNVSLTASETNSIYDLAASLRRRVRDLEKAKEDNKMDQATLNAEESKAQVEFEKQLRALLGDDRYGALRGTSPTVGELRRSFRGLEVDEQQFAALLQAEDQWDTARSQLEQQQIETGGTNFQQINALTAQRDQTFANILGTNGFALFQKQQDSRYVELQKNAARWGIDSTSIDWIYNAIQVYENADADYQRKVRMVESEGVKLDADLQQPLRDYARQMAQYLRTNLSEAQYNAISENQILPFASP